MGLATLLSRILGMAREMVYARFMGDGMVASAFFYAFQVCLAFFPRVNMNQVKARSYVFS